MLENNKKTGILYTLNTYIQYDGFNTIFLIVNSYKSCMHFAFKIYETICTLTYEETHTFSCTTVYEVA